jgi:opacity protein-like surface antigen
VNTSYQYLGKFNASGNATFSTRDYAQVLTTKAHGLYVGAAAGGDLSSKIFAEVTGDLGVAFVKSNGTQGANLGGSGVFPSASHSNFSWGIGAGLGYRMSDKVSLVTRVKYFDAGKADTALSGPNAGSLGMNVDERLETKLKATTATVGIRFAL